MGSFLPRTSQDGDAPVCWVPLCWRVRVQGVPHFANSLCTWTSKFTSFPVLLNRRQHAMDYSTVSIQKGAGNRFQPSLSMGLNVVRCRADSSQSAEEICCCILMRQSLPPPKKKNSKKSSRLWMYVLSSWAFHVDTATFTAVSWKYQRSSGTVEM